MGLIREGFEAVIAASKKVGRNIGTFLGRGWTRVKSIPLINSVVTRTSGWYSKLSGPQRTMGGGLLVLGVTTVANMIDSRSDRQLLDNILADPDRPAENLADLIVNLNDMVDPEDYKNLGKLLKRGVKNADSLTPEDFDNINFKDEAVLSMIVGYCALTESKRGLLFGWKNAALVTVCDAYLASGSETQDPDERMLELLPVVESSMKDLYDFDIFDTSNYLVDFLTFARLLEFKLYLASAPQMAVNRLSPTVRDLADESFRSPLQHLVENDKTSGVEDSDLDVSAGAPDSSVLDSLINAYSSEEPAATSSATSEDEGEIGDFDSFKSVRQ